MSKKPNILFLLTDDQRFDTIRALGNNSIMTPNMDMLVSEGTAFTHGHIPGGTSGAICMPSRAMINTGRSLFHIQGEGQEINDNHVTLGECFQNAGYFTFGAGKWHNGTASYARSFNGGAEIFFGGMWDHWNVPTCDFDPTGKYDNQIKFTMNFSGNNKPININCDKFSKGKHSSEIISDAAINFLNGYDSEQPFLMYVSYLAPHDPRTMPDRFKNMYNPDDIVLPENFKEQHPFDYGVVKMRDETLAPYPRTEECVKRHIADYYGIISHLDYEIGRIINSLKDKGEYENTIIVLAGDNGLAIGQHGLMGKQSNYEHSVRVPLIFCGPGVPKGVKTDKYAYLFDIYPTLCELTGASIPETVEGKSLVSAMHNGETPRASLYFAYNDIIRSVKDNKFKLIEYAIEERQTQLFDLENDPIECENLYGKAEYSHIVEKLRALMEKYCKEWDDMKHPYGKTFWDKYSKASLPCGE